MNALTSYIRLLSSFAAQELSATEFEARYLRLYKQEETLFSDETFLVLDELFGDVDAFYPNPDLRDEDDLDEEQLHQRCARALEKLNAIQNRQVQPLKHLKIRVTEEIWREGDMYVSYCPEFDIVSCGASVEDARKNLKDVIVITLEETQKVGTFEKFLQEAGFEESQGEVLSLRKELVEFAPLEIAI